MKVELIIIVVCVIASFSIFEPVSAKSLQCIEGEMPVVRYNNPTPICIEENTALLWIEIGFAEIFTEETVVYLIDDTFDHSMDGWIYSSFGNAPTVPKPTDNYTAELISNNTESFVLISGDGYAIISGIQKTVNIPPSLSDTNFILSFDAISISDDSGFSTYPNLRFDLFDKFENRIVGECLVCGGPVKNEWQHFQHDITQLVGVNKKITVLLGVSDHWIIDYKQKLFLDNIQLIATTEEPQPNEIPNPKPLIDKSDSVDKNKRLQGQIDALTKQNQELQEQLKTLTDKVDRLQSILERILAVFDVRDHK